MKKTSFFGLVLTILLVIILAAGCGSSNSSKTTPDTNEPADETQTEETQIQEEIETADELPKPEEKKASDYTCDDFEELKTTLEEDKKTLLLESNKLSTLRDPMAQRRQQFKIEKLSRSITSMEKQVILLTAECQ